MDNTEPVKFKGKILELLGLGMFKASTFKKTRKDVKCWKCSLKISEMEDDDYLSLVKVKGIVNQFLCTPCSIFFMDKGVNVVRNNLPDNYIRKYRIDKLNKIL